MCLQVPGKVIKINGNKATVDYDIEKREVIIADVKPKVGDWVLVLAQFVIDKVPEDVAIESLAHWKKTMS